MTQRKSFKYTWLLGAALLLAYVLDNQVFGPQIGGFLGNYLLPTLMWGLIIVLILWLPRVRAAGKLRLHRLVCYLALMCVVINLLGELLQGMLVTFGRSPYDRSLAGVIINLITISTFIIGLEMSRHWLLNRHFLKRPIIGIPLIALLFSLFSIPLNKITNLSDGMAVTKFIGMDVLPELGQNMLATYLVFLEGPVPAILYQGGLILFERLSPVLPNADWAMETLLGILAPVLGLVLVKSIYQEETGEIRVSSREDNPLGWILTSLAVILILWFSVGVFSYTPRVIVSGSMRPGIDIGDIVIIKETDGSQVQLGDIIMFPLGNMKITHRIIDIEEREGVRYFTTKGDANAEPDTEPVLEANVMGKVIMVIPKAGKFTLWIRSIV
ncbi:MAG: signal peptidase I [Syntrophomonadaceae bacterium]|nr:signal peptidase I [Syntrophomonadaceae bacterium]